MKKTVAFAVVLGVFIKLFIFDILIVRGESMLPSIKDGETLVVNRLAYGLSFPFSGKRFCSWKKVKKNDVMIYFYQNKQVVKRAAAISGETLEYSKKYIYNDNDSEFEIYSLIVGDKAVPITESQYLRLKDVKAVPEGYILALGDNYDVSLDSRTYGFVSEKNIIGKVLWK